MNGPKGSGDPASGSEGASASTCFLCHCQLEIHTGTMINVSSCEGLSDFLLKEGLLPSRPLIRTGEDVCRFCLSDLWQLQELLNKEKELRKQMSQTAELIKGRESGQQESAATAGAEEIAGQAENPEGEDSEEEDVQFEVLSTSTENEEGDTDAGAIGESEEEQEMSNGDEEENASSGEPSSSSSDEDDDDYRVSPPSKSNARTKFARGPRKKRRSKGGSYPCEVSGCRAKLGNKDALYKHFRHAHNHRPFRCREPSCNTAYSYPKHLKEHMVNVHQSRGRRPFRCGVEGCDKRFSSSIYLNAHHYRVHSGKTVRTCGICGKKLTTTSGLGKHMSLHARRRKEEKEWRSSRVECVRE